MNTLHYTGTSAYPLLPPYNGIVKVDTRSVLTEQIAVSKSLFNAFSTYLAALLSAFSPDMIYCLLSNV